MKIIAFVGLLFVVGTSCVPTPNQVRLAIERAKSINTLKRELNTLEARNVESPKASGCPVLARFHGRRSNTNKEQEREATDLMLAARLLLSDGYTHEDLQHESVVAEFSRQTTNSGCSPTFAACNNNAAYRTADGSCNNLQNPTFGMAGVPQRRVLPPVYSDGVESPRSRGITGGELPNPRRVSNSVHRGGANEIRSRDITLHTFQMGQFLDHDIIATPLQTEVTNCCNSPADTQNCININIQRNDPFNPMFTQGYCMGVPRSAPVFCPDATSTTPRRQQINEITSFIDASNVYGSSDAEQAALRDGAFLKTEGNSRLPNNPDQTACRANNAAGEFCSLAGDHRVNVVPSLTAYHNVFVLEHNRIARLLESSYPDQETLFQETRKIIVAIMQKIVYDEFLPSFLSSSALTKYKLRSTQSFTYEPTLDPTVSNSFGIAYRMGHTWIPRDMSLFDRRLRPFLRLETDDTYENPELTYATGDPSGMEGLAYWLSGANSPATDRIVEEQARSRLFIDRDENIAFDLVALNIQRGRDHGLPSYNEFRKACQLPSASDWESLVDHDSDTRTRLQNAGYQSPEDIDLFTGSLTETPSDGSGVGPTLECILGDQFMRLKFADRFWYQGEAVGLNNAQQSAIREYTMSKIMCEHYNFDRIHYPSVFEADDVRTQCRDIPALNVDVFKPVRTTTTTTTTTTNAPTPRPTRPPPPPPGNGGRPRPRTRTVEQMMEELLRALEEQEKE